MSTIMSRKIYSAVENNDTEFIYAFIKKCRDDDRGLFLKSEIICNSILFNKPNIFNIFFENFSIDEFPMYNIYNFICISIEKCNMVLLNKLLSYVNKNCFASFQRNDFIRLAFITQNLDIIIRIINFTKYKLLTYFTLHSAILMRENIDQFRNYIQTRPSSEVFKLCVPRLFDEYNVNAHRVVDRINQEHRMRKWFSDRLNADVVWYIYEYLTY